MKTILITGATGNIGREVIRFLYERGTTARIVAGVRDVARARSAFGALPKLEFVRFDFEAADTFAPALAGIDCVFLLRPPHIADVNRHFRPLISRIAAAGIRQIVFLSVQGAQTSPLIPHHKIENHITKSGLDCVFLRPGYFMQNLTTTLLGDIQRHRAIILPAGKAKFNWIDAANIGEAGAVTLMNFEKYKGQALDITGSENESFSRVVDQVNAVIPAKIRYQDVHPLKYYALKRKEGVARGLILVMIMLHFLPRFQKEPRISDVCERLTGKKPTLIREFIARERAALEG